MELANPKSDRPPAILQPKLELGHAFAPTDLTDAEVRGLLSDAAACTPPGSRIAFTHAIPGERKLLSVLVRLIGEPWKSAVLSEDLPEYIEGTGWAVISDIDTESAHGLERYAVAERR